MEYSEAGLDRWGGSFTCDNTVGCFGKMDVPEVFEALMAIEYQACGADFGGFRVYLDRINLYDTGKSGSVTQFILT